MSKIKMFLIAYDQREWVGSQDQPFNDGPYSGFRHREIEVSNFRLYRTDSFYPDISHISYSDYETIENDAAYDTEGPFVAVINLFTDGGTFGRTSGYVEIHGVFHASDQIAIDECVKKARERDYGYFGNLDQTIVEHFDSAPFLTGRSK